MYDIAIGEPEPAESPAQEALRNDQAELLAKRPDPKQWTLEVQAAVAVLQEAAETVFHIRPVYRRPEKLFPLVWPGGTFDVALRLLQAPQNQSDKNLTQHHTSA